MTLHELSQIERELREMGEPISEFNEVIEHGKTSIAFISSACSEQEYTLVFRFNRITHELERFTI